MTEKKLYRFCGETKAYIRQSVILSSCRLFAGIGFSYLFAKLLVDILEKKMNISFLGVALGLGLIVFIKQFCIRQVANKLALLVSEVKENLRKAIYQKVLRLGMSYQEMFKTQEIIHLAVDGVEQLENYFGGYLTQLYYCFVSSIFLFAVIVPWNKTIAFLLLIMACLIPLSLQLMLRLVKQVQKKYWSKYASVGTLFLDSLQGMTTLKLYGADERREKEIASLSEEFRRETMRVLKMQLASIAIINWIVYGGTVAAIVFAVLSYSQGELSLFGLLFLFMIAPEFFIPMRSLTALFHVAMTGVAAGEEMIVFLQKEEKENFGEEVYPKEAKISTRNLTFYYSNQKRAIQGLNLQFKSRQLTAIVGHSGCGKSTLASLLAGEILPEKNQIFVNDLDIRNLKIGELNHNVLRITHDGHIFSGTVRENIGMGNVKASEEEMIEALKKVCLWEMFQKKEGLDTRILSQGKNISGGQAQRLSLARALLHDAKVYIFDEANSNVDIESEEIILSVIYELAKEKTVIYISHRLASIRSANKIYVMEDGKVIQEGTHEELYREEGRYQSMYKEQEELECFRQGGSDEAE